MKSKLIRNAILTVALGLSAALLPSERTVAQTDPCIEMWTQWALCVSAGGGAACDEYYWNVIYPYCILGGGG